jgi:hypothetical protein
MCALFQSESCDITFQVPWYTVYVPIFWYVPWYMYHGTRVHWYHFGTMVLEYYHGSHLVPLVPTTGRYGPNGPMVHVYVRTRVRTVRTRVLRT